MALIIHLFKHITNGQNSIISDFYYPTWSQPVLGYLNGVWKILDYWSILSWIQSYMYMYVYTYIHVTTYWKRVEYFFYFSCTQHTLTGYFQ